MIYKILFMLLILLSSTHTYALGKLGHQLVCELAYQQLSNSDKKKVDDVLQSIPKSHKEAINKYNYQKKGAQITLATSCTWADAIKNKAKFKSFKSWHYLNVPRDEKTVSEKHCKKPCLASAINIHQQQLKTTNDTNEKWQAMLFLGHWLGDIHQPLHVSYKSDLGGNKRAISSSLVKCKNLHWLWDSCLLNYDQKSKKIQQNFPVLLAQLKTMTPTNSESIVDESSAWFWANESFNIVKQQRFNYCRMNEKSCLPIKEKVINLEANYFEHYAPVLKQQIVNSAQRLARVLEQSL